MGLWGGCSAVKLPSILKQFPHWEYCLLKYLNVYINTCNSGKHLFQGIKMEEQSKWPWIQHSILEQIIIGTSKYTIIHFLPSWNTEYHGLVSLCIVKQYATFIYFILLKCICISYACIDIIYYSVYRHCQCHSCSLWFISICIPQHSL